jgi:NAD(P)H-dependent FMN reductase
MNIEIIAGSPRKNSVNFRVALFLKQLLQQRTSHHVNIIDVRDWELPLQEMVFSTVEKTPVPFKPLAEQMLAADALIMVSPEYNGSYTSALKNLMDYFPKQSHKAMAIVTTGPGAMGGMRASQQMQLLVGALFGILSPYMLITPAVDKKFDAEGNLLDPAFQKAVDTFVNEFLWLAESLKPEPVMA